LYDKCNSYVLVTR